jgi:hypothetical protein
MDGTRLFAIRRECQAFATVLLMLLVVGCSGNRETGRSVAPFGSVQTYNQTVVPVVPRPRGKMVNPNAFGIDLVKKAAQVDESTRPVSTNGPVD